MRHWTRKQTRGHRPFQTKGANLYVAYAASDPGASSFRFRKLRAMPQVATCGSESAHGSTAGAQKSTAVATVADPTAQFVYSLPAAMASTTAYFQVRTCELDVENESNWAPIRKVLDAARAETLAIYGTAIILSQQQRAGGIVRLRVAYTPSLQGIQPVTLRAARTAGPTSPANADVTFYAGQRVYEIDTPSLSDASPYTYKITAINGATTLDLITGITVNADATGPTAPTSGTATVY